MVLIVLPCQPVRLRTAHPCAQPRSTVHPEHKKTLPVNPAGSMKGLGLGEKTEPDTRVWIAGATARTVNK